MDVSRSTIVAVAAAALLVGAAFGATFAGAPQSPASQPTEWSASGDSTLEQFESDAAFERYFRNAERHSYLFMRPQVTSAGLEADDAAAGGADGGGDGADGAPTGGDAEDAAGDSSGTSGTAGDRDVSETNRQVAALDEPDVLKTDGESAFYGGYRFHRGDGETSVLDLSDPAEPKPVATIPAAGELLLVEETETLVVFENERLWGYDVSDPANPEQAWSEPLDADLDTARLYDGELYLVLVDRPDGANPCPVAGFGGDPVPCTEVYRPGAQADADAVYTAARVDPATGEVTDETSVVGSQRRSATYVSESAIYLSYTRSVSDYEVMSGYLTGPGVDDLGLDADTVDRLRRLDDLDISERAKRVELEAILDSWLDGLEDEERREAHEKMDDGLAAYAEERQRDLTTTGIARIAIDGDLEVTDSGEVPGFPLNQWSMDEHEGHLRIATTIPGSHGADSVNDVYVLDSALEVTGSVQGLGETERIYAVRFEGDEGYVVTFRQIDPFYTLDLSDPQNPALEGELKIPGFSTYLHPLDDAGDLILGVGEQDGKVKLSTFDVSDRQNPDELDAEILEDERFSEAVQNHRAFLHDAENGAFFVPAGESSYVYSYADGNLTRETEVDLGGPGVRAMYVEDYLYVFGEGELVVLDRGAWAEHHRVDLR
ncbi:beta-propeller domain-containing protein [Halovivax limisalsi]|uniref:beta-propeller domain-containing protein n=1 Tax=Halovivax limisalsi TaxID=1453760 RepID=UPI001FFD07A7|nr:beta-propeller domain-containing protein [Halovivax limisalsi]